MFLNFKERVLLARALAANAAFPATSGLVLIVARDALHGAIPAPGWSFVALGVGLLVFAAALSAMAARPALARRLAMQVVASDLAWVVATTAALLVRHARLSTLGKTLIVGVKLVVALLAFMQ